jgi:hypothetical protein
MAWQPGGGTRKDSSYTGAPARQRINAQRRNRGRTTVKREAQRIVDSLTSSSPEDIRKYIELLRTALGEYSQVVRRSVVHYLVIVFLFEVVLSAKTVELSLGPVKLSRASDILIFIPILAAFVFNETLVASLNYASRARLMTAAFQVWNKEGEKIT